nr:U3 small nucleolar RNA-associated protein 4 homolog [Cherax quadricarinatus]
MVNLNNNIKSFQMGEFTLHNVRFYDFEPQAIQCMAYEESTSRLALSRADASVEIWNCERRPFVQLVLPGGDDSSVEALVWCNGRLFSAGFHGFILEYDLANGGIKSRTAVTGGPTWCLALSSDKKNLAAGTEEGYVCIFNIMDEGIMYDTTLEKQEGRILNICWHISGNYIVTGSVNYVRLWFLKEGRTTPPRWDTAGVLKERRNMQDFRGKTCFWNAELGTITDTVQTHQAGVLCLAVCSDQKSVYVAGVDPVIVQVTHIETGAKKGRKECWVKSIQRSIHTHDVRALALNSDDKIYSGGVDTILALSYYPPKTVIKFPALPHPGSISVAGEAESLLLRYRDHLELWRLGKSCQDSRSAGQFLPLSHDRVKLLEVQAREDEVIDWCAVSPQALWIAYIVKGNLRIFQFYPPMPGSQASVRRVRVMSKDIENSWQVLWLGEARLASAATNGVIQVITVSEMEASLEKELHLKPDCTVIQMNSNPDGSVLVVVDNQHTVTAFDLGKNNSSVLPCYSSPVTAIGVHPSTRDIVVVYADMMIKEYSLATQKYTDFCRKFLHTHCSDLTKKNSVIHNVSFDACHTNLIFLHDDSSIIVIDKTKAIMNEEVSKPGKIRRNNPVLNQSFSNLSNSVGNSRTTAALSFVQRSNQIVYFTHVKKESLVSVELNPLQLIDKLPPALLKVKKFGGV